MNTIITIGRQYGSGGAEMAKRLGERLGRLGIGARAVEQVAREQDDLRPVRPRQLRQSAQQVALLPAALRRLRAGQPARAAHTGIARKRALDLDLRDERDEQRRHDQHQIRHIKAIIITVVHGSHPF